MKLAQIAACGAVIALAYASQAAEKLELKDAKAKTSYALGWNFGNSFKEQGIEVDPEILARALKDCLAGTEGSLTEAEVKQVLSNLRAEIGNKMAEKGKAESGKNKKEGEVFLAENKKKPGVVTLPSGLQYKVITEGKGAIPKETDEVTTHYRGTLINGTEFDSSYSRNEPATFPVTGVIRGWTEALKLMKTGSKWQLFIPSDLAYAERGAPPVIGPNAVLVFEIELLSIK